MQIFVSYTKPDQDFTKQLVEDLRKKGARLWFDMTDAPQNDEQAWQTAVQEALENADILLLVLNADALQEDFIKTDWKNFENTRRPVIAVMVDRFTLPETIRDRVDFSGKYDQALHRLQHLLLEHSTRLSSNKWRRKR